MHIADYIQAIFDSIPAIMYIYWAVIMVMFSYCMISDLKDAKNKDDSCKCKGKFCKCLGPPSP